jgi:hypothetical protein
MGQVNVSSFNRHFARSVLDDGTVIFDTPDPLVGGDTNAARDVYSYRHGRVTLISRGTQPKDAIFDEATPDGSNIFFVTWDRLVGQDVDESPDLYNARIGGGIAAQDPEHSAGPCDGTNCKPPASGRPSADVLPSTGLQRGGDVVVPRGSARLLRVSAAVRSRLGRTGRARIAVLVNRAGRVRAVARARIAKRLVVVASAGKSAEHKGTVWLTLSLSKAARRALARSGRLKLSLSIGFSGQLEPKRSTLELRRTHSSAAAKGSVARPATVPATGEVR